jgi:hypothetical protein
LGDTIQFCRFVKRLAESGAEVILEVQRALCGLLRSLEGVTHLMPSGGVLPHFDYHCPVMSLPLAFKTTLATIPCENAYLRSDADLGNQWRIRLLRDNVPLIGLAWSGSAINRHDKDRSMALAVGSR